jgi:hypothetical protein
MQVPRWELENTLESSRDGLGSLLPLAFGNRLAAGERQAEYSNDGSLFQHLIIYPFYSVAGG